MLRLRIIATRLLPVSLVAAFALGVSSPAQAQAQVSFNGVLTSVPGGGNQPTGIAVDPAGNLYEIIFGGNQQLKQTLQLDGTYIESSIGTGFAFPTAVAIDASGNLFIPDPYHNSVAELTPSGATYTRTTLNLNAGVSPNAIALDSAGNLYVGSNGNNSVYKETPSGGAYIATPIVSGLTNAPSGIAVDANGVVYITDPANNQILIETPSSGSYTQTTLGAGLSNPQGVTVDYQGNVYIADSGNNRIVKETISGGAYTESVLTTAVSNPQQLTLDASGNLYIANDGGGNFLELHLPSVPFGNRNVGGAVGSSATTLALPFTITAGTTLGSVSVLTTGAAAKDFTDAGSSTCVAQTYAIDTTCVVNVQFSPLAPGVRRGAVVLFDALGNPLATVPLYGTGIGPQAAYTPTSIQTIASGLNSPYGLAVNDAGDVFLADSGNGRVLKVAANGTVSTVSSSFTTPTSLAIDGAGNLYVSDIGTQSVSVITPAGIQTEVVPGLAYPFGVTIDKSGNLFIVNSFNHEVLKVTPSGTPVAVGGPYSTPVAIAFDADGNSFVVDYDFGTVVKVAPDGTRSTIISGLHQPAHIALDPSGTIYIAEFGTGHILQFSHSGTPKTLASSTHPFGIATDTAGNLYFSDLTTKLVQKLIRATPPTLSFPNTAVGSTSTGGPRQLALQNTGNAQLDFSAISYPTDFPEHGSPARDCSVSAPLLATASCTFTADFKPLGPLAAGTSLPLNEGISITTNLLIPVQSIPVSGTEFVLPASATPVISLPGGSYNNTQTATITDSTAGATIYYTLNGTNPTTASKKYTGPIAITGTSTLKAIAIGPGFSASLAASASFNFTVATPVVTPTGGTTVDPQTVTITCDTADAVILYSTTGSNPNSNSPRYTGPISITSTQWLKVFAYKPAYTSSPIVANHYNIQSPPATPTFLPAGGTYNNAQSVTLTESVPGAAIYYTVNGTTPTTSSFKYTGPITVKGSSTLRAIAVAPGYAPTSPVAATYNMTAATPVVSLNSGTYTGPQTVTITSDTDGAVFTYSTTGSNPNNNSPKYTGPITISASQTLKVFTSKPGYTSSPIVTVTYTIQ